MISPLPRLWFLLAVIFLSFGLYAQSEFLNDPAPIRPLASKSLMLDITRFGDQIAAAGDRGQIIISSDHGKTWQQSQVPTRVLLTAIHFTDETTGWAVGHNETILKSVDAGKTWEFVRQNLKMDPLLDLWFESKDHGFVSGAYGVLLETKDGGENWEQIYLNDEDDFHLNQINGIPGGPIFIASERDNLNERGVSYRSLDDGATWERMLMPYSGSYFGNLIITPERVLFFGLRGHIFLSEDTGQTWEKIESGTTALLNDAVLTSNGNIYIVGMGGTVLFSSDQGVTFEKIDQGHQESFSAVVETKEGQLLAAGQGGVLKLKLK